MTDLLREKEVWDWKEQFSNNTIISDYKEIIPLIQTSIGLEIFNISDKKVIIIDEPLLENEGVVESIPYTNNSAFIETLPFHQAGVIIVIIPLYDYGMGGIDDYSFNNKVYFFE